MNTSKTLALAATALLLGTGCGAEPVELGPYAPFAGGGQEPAPPAADYPSGPYGLGVGSVIPEMRFIGYARLPALNRHDKVVSPPVEIALSDFYNPTGDEVYAAGSPHGAGRRKPTMLLLVIQQVWCPPSNYTTQLLSQRYPSDRDEGVAYMEVLEDGPEWHVPATLDDLDLWESRYRIHYSAAVDPEGMADMINVEGGWPLLAEVDTTTMQIVKEHLGEPDEAFWLTFESDVYATRP